jgi:hypothetical protein
MDSHFVTLALSMGRLPALHPPSCHRCARFSLRQNASSLEASNVSHRRVVAALAVAIAARNMLQSWISSLRSVTGLGPSIEMDLDAIRDAHPWPEKRPYPGLVGLSWSGVVSKCDCLWRVSRPVGQFLRRSGGGAGWHGSYSMASLATAQSMASASFATTALTVC